MSKKDETKSAFILAQQMLLIITTMSSFFSLLYFRQIRIINFFRFKINPFLNYGKSLLPIQNSIEERDKSSRGPRRTEFGFSWLIGVAVGVSLWGCINHKKLLIYSESNDPLQKKNSEQDSSTNSPRQKFNFIASVVEKVASAVVYIEIQSHSRSPNFNFNEPQTVSNGSGFIIEENGLILTNAHVVLGQPNSLVQVKLHDGRIFQGKIENIDTASDLATLRINCNELPTLKLGSSSDAKPGEWVVAVGSPLSLTNTITTGVISSINRGSIELGLQKNKDMEYIQTDASITFGNSGGPLINLDGEVIGVNAMKVTPGISFAIPIDYVKDFLKTLKQNSTKEMSIKERIFPTKRRYLGVTLLTLTPRLITELQMRGTELPPDVKNGVLVWKTVIGSPAHWGGIQPGDVLVSINDDPVSCSQDVYRKLETKEEVIKVSIIRKKELLNFLISLEDLPQK